MLETLLFQFLLKSKKKPQNVLHIWRNITEFFKSKMFHSCAVNYTNKKKKNSNLMETQSIQIFPKSHLKVSNKINI